jgi:hypothetical protein
MTWNLSEFINGDDFSYTAGKEIHGSVVDPATVQYRSDDPNKEHQKCIIHPGASITFTAGESVHLHPGFHAEDGSYFRAVPEPVTKINIHKLPKEFDEQIIFEVENAKLIELSFYTDQTRDSLVYGKQYFVDPKSSIAVTNVDTILAEKKYYAVAYFYSGKGSHAYSEGWINNSNKSMKHVNSSSSYANITNSNEYYSQICTIYPNPSLGIFNIEFQQEDISKFSIEVVNTMGYTVYEKQNIPAGTEQINISSQSKGMYFVIVRAGDKVYTEKVVYR